MPLSKTFTTISKKVLLKSYDLESYRNIIEDGVLSISYILCPFKQVIL